MLDKDKIKNSLTKYDIVKIMKLLGSELQREGEGELIFQTICHNGAGEGSDKLYYYPDNKIFYCYTSCGAMDIYGVVTNTRKSMGENMLFPQALNYVAEVTGKSFSKRELSTERRHIIDDWSFLRKYSKIGKEKKEKAKLREVPENNLSYFVQLPHISWIEEGISWCSQKRFEIGYDWRTDKITIPHRDKDGRLIGIRGRALSERDLEEGRKYMPMYLGQDSFEHPLGSNLYGLSHNMEAIQNLKKVIVFEGEKSVIKCDDFLELTTILV